MTEKILNKLDVEKNGNELKSFKNNQNYNNQRIKNYSDDYKHSLIFLISGLFLWLPLIFNLIFFRSPNIQARRFSAASLIIGTCYFISTVISLSIAYVYQPVGNY
ncbi:hypothetical protein ACTFIZ_006326 [Dictyostelium cf. discoideum]